MMASSNNSPCAACKIQRRKCTQECVFAPYFPPDNPQRFAYVHKVFGASNVAKLLNDLNPSQREDAVKSLAYEAEARLRDPVYGCVGLISLLQHRLKQLQTELNHAKKELASYAGPLLQPPQPPRNYNNNAFTVLPQMVGGYPPQQEVLRFEGGSVISPSLALGLTDQCYEQQQQAHLMLSPPSMQPKPETRLGRSDA